MFKSKLTFKVFDKHDRSAPHLTSVKMKNNARASCGKLSNQAGTTTPFHLILDYFDDQPGEPKGPFIDFGDHTALQKHFDKIETKPGGQQKRFSESVKQAAAGVAFVAKKKGKEVVYLVPLRSKISPAGWNKFLKKSKALFGNRKGLVISEQEWKTLSTNTDQAPTANKKEASNPHALALSQLQEELTDLATHLPTLTAEERQAKLTQHKATLVQLIAQYDKNKRSMNGRALETAVQTWRNLKH
jgi:antitoxin (DNA-binding transcriptional repressor) of toxin-antitoxin stability system